MSKKSLDFALADGLTGNLMPRGGYGCQRNGFL